MSNTCFTTYMVTGKDEDIKSLHETLMSMQRCKSPLVPNDWYEANMWLGCLVKALGGDPETIECRGFISGFSICDDGTLQMDIETAWNEYPELRHFIENHYDGMKILYFEDACEDGILNTNDLKRKYFKNRVFIDSDGCFSEYDDGYFETFKVAAEAVSEIVGRNVRPTSKAIERALEAYMEVNPGEWFSYHKVNFVDD